MDPPGAVVHAEPDEAANQTSRHIVDAALLVHTRLGPGLLEKADQACLEYELRKRGCEVNREVAAPLVYDDVRLDVGYRLDLVVDGRVIVEVKAVDEIHPVHVAQVLTYLKVTGCEVGLILNFNSRLLAKGGIKRVVRTRTQEA